MFIFCMIKSIDSFIDKINKNAYLFELKSILRNIKNILVRKTKLSSALNLIELIMKVILLFLITINTIFGGRCPPKDIISPCECVQVKIC